MAAGAVRLPRWSPGVSAAVMGRLSATCPICGADDEIRTRDIDLGKVALYQLSYIRRTPEGRGTDYPVAPTTGDRHRR